MRFWPNCPPKGHYAASDNGTIVRAAALLAAPRATELLVRIVRRNAPARLWRLRRSAAALRRGADGATGDLEQIAAALIDALPGDPTRPRAGRTWNSANARDAGLRCRSSDGDESDRCGARGAWDRATCWPGRRHTSRTDVLIPAARAFASRWKARRGRRWGVSGRRLSTTCAGASPCRCRRHGTGPGPNPLKCNCADCRGLGAFLVAPGEQQWRLRAVQDRRTHVEQSVPARGVRP